jgi:hypothetical protein
MWNHLDEILRSAAGVAAVRERISLKVPSLRGRSTLPRYPMPGGPHHILISEVN